MLWTDRQALVIHVLNRFSQTLRQISCGEYRDECAASDASLRLQFRTRLMLGNLKVTLSKNVPDVESSSFSGRISKGLTDMRGRSHATFAYVLPKLIH